MKAIKEALHILARAIEKDSELAAIANSELDAAFAELEALEKAGVSVTRTEKLVVSTTKRRAKKQTHIS